MFGLLCPSKKCVTLNYTTKCIQDAKWPKSITSCKKTPNPQSIVQYPFKSVTILLFVVQVKVGNNPLLEKMSVLFLKEFLENRKIFSFNIYIPFFGYVNRNPATASPNQFFLQM